MPFLEATDYKSPLHGRLLERKRVSASRFNFQRMAAHCRVQKTYLSKVFHDPKTHLSPDQLFLAMEFLELTKSEKEFIALLYEHNRSSLPERTRVLEQRLAETRSTYRKTEKHIESRALTTSTASLSSYYLEPTLQLIHMFLTTKKYSKSPSAIANALGIDLASVQKGLQILKQLGLVKASGESPAATDEQLHLSSDSELYRPYKNLMRLKALERIQQDLRGENYDFSVFFSCSPKVRDQLQELFLKYIAKVQKLVSESECEEVYQINFDLVKWG